VETNEIFLILGVFLPIFFTVIWQLNRINPSKKGVKRSKDQADSSISELIGVQNSQTKVILDQKNNQIKSLERKLSYFDEDSEEEDSKEVKFEDLKILAKQQGINPLILEMPFVKKNVIKYTKGMSLEEVLESIKEIDKLTGGKILKGGAKQKQDDPFKQYTEQNRMDWG